MGLYQAVGYQGTAGVLQLDQFVRPIQFMAKSEVVTVCSWQFAGEDRLQSTAMILITREPHRCDGHWRR